MTECYFCRHVNWCCGNNLMIDGECLECTREEGHKGKHVACGNIRHDIKRWK